MLYHTCSSTTLSSLSENNHVHFLYMYMFEMIACGVGFVCCMRDPASAITRNVCKMLYYSRCINIPLCIWYDVADADAGKMMCSTNIRQVRGVLYMYQSLCVVCLSTSLEDENRDILDSINSRSTHRKTSHTNLHIYAKKIEIDVC